MSVAMLLSCFVRSRTLFWYFRWLGTVYKIHFADAWTINEPYLPAGQDVIQYHPPQRTCFSQYQTLLAGDQERCSRHWQASEVKDEEEGRCRRVTGISIVVAGIQHSVGDSSNYRPPSGLNKPLPQHFHKASKRKCLSCSCSSCFQALLLGAFECHLNAASSWKSLPSLQANIECIQHR